MANSKWPQWDKEGLSQKHCGSEEMLIADKLIANSYTCEAAEELCIGNSGFLQNV